MTRSRKERTELLQAEGEEGQGAVKEAGEKWSVQGRQGVGADKVVLWVWGWEYGLLILFPYSSLVGTISSRSLMVRETAIIIPKFYALV